VRSSLRKSAIISQGFRGNRAGREVWKDWERGNWYRGKKVGGIGGGELLIGVHISAGECQFSI